MPRLVVEAGAAQELDEAYAWYEARDEGLGLEFLRAADAVFALLKRSPATFPLVYRELRRVMLRRFPYSIYYTLSGEMVHVVACTHQRRHPRRWRRRA